MEIKYKTSEKLESELTDLMKSPPSRIGGEEIRQFVTKLAELYQTKPYDLKSAVYDERYPYLQGASSSAFYLLTRDIKPLFIPDFGGLGVTFESSKEKLHLHRNQFWFAKLKGDALKYARNAGNSLWFSENSDNSLMCSHNHENALWYSFNSRRSLEKSNNFNFSLTRSVNGENSLSYSENTNNALFESSNADSSLQNSNNRLYSLQGSKNRGRALEHSRNSDLSLQLSVNSGFSLRYSVNRDRSLQGSRNSQSALAESRSLNDFSLKGKDIDLNYDENYILEEIGRVMGVTREAARQNLKNAVKKVRSAMLKIIDETDLREELSRSSSKEDEYMCNYKGELPWVTRYPYYSADIRTSDSIGLSSRHGNLGRFFASGFTTKIMWAKRNGLFNEE